MNITLDLKKISTITWIPEIKEYLVIENKNNCFLVPSFCKHENTKLPPLKKGESCIVCPKHGWELDLINKKYRNPIGIKHTESKFVAYIKDEIVIISEREKIDICNDEKWLETKADSISKKDSIDSSDFQIEFINHASLIIKTEFLSIVTDPWIIGSAFSTGWFLQNKTKKSSIEQILNCDFVFISHSHPDHLNPNSLLWLKNKNWDPVFIVPKFKKKDFTKDLLFSIGFRKFIELANKEKCELIKGSNFHIQMIQDLSDRNDSGLLISYKNKKIVNLVDIPSPDIEGLNNIDIAFLPFANGASGYPICWQEIMNIKEIIRFKTNDNLNALRVFHERVNKLGAKVAVPFAGYFTSSLPEDKFINKINKLNKPEDVFNFKKKINYEILNPLLGLTYSQKDNKFKNKFKFKSSKKVNNDFKIALRNIILKRYQNFTRKEMIDFLKIQDFKDQLVICINAKDINFEKSYFQVYWDFYANKSITKKKFDQIYMNHKYRKIIINVRKYSLGYTIRNSLPWEEFSIGFQARFKRYPNLYNFSFWDYFQNHYNFTNPLLGDYIDLWENDDKLQKLFDKYI